MNPWHILGIERTSDTSIIRKAYKQKLRFHHPEDDPVGYQTVRDAYDRAMKSAKMDASLEVKSSNGNYNKSTATYNSDQYTNNKKFVEDIEHTSSNVAISTENIVSDFEVKETLKVPQLEKLLKTNEVDVKSGNHHESNEDFEIEDREINKDNEQNEDREVIRSSEANKDREVMEDSENNEDYVYYESYTGSYSVESFIARVERLYFDERKKNNVDDWQTLFSDKIMWDIEKKEYLQQCLLYFLEKHHNVSDSVLQVIETHTNLYELMINEKYPLSIHFVNRYAVANKKHLLPTTKEEVKTTSLHKVRFTDSFAKYSMVIPIRLIGLIIVFHAFSIVMYIIYCFVRMCMYPMACRKMFIVGEHGFVYVNTLGKIKQYSYFDVDYVNAKEHKIKIKMKNGKKIKIITKRFSNQDYFLWKLRRYGYV